MDCPLLEKCRKMGMECEGRKFAECHLYKLLLKERKEIENEKLRKSWIKAERKQEALQHG